MATIIKNIKPNEIPGWIKFTPKLVDHGNSRPLKYKVIKPQHESKKVVFYLHGLGGSLSECPEYDTLFVEELNLSFVRIEHPLMSLDDLLQGAALLAGINPGTIFQALNNTSKMIDAIVKKEGFSSVGIIGVSYGGFSAIINAIRGKYAKKSMLVSSTPDIAFAMEKFPELFADNPAFKIAMKVLSVNFQTEGRNIRSGKGLLRNYWDNINPWVEPANKDLEIRCIGNYNDPVMPGISLKKYKEWMSENHKFNNISFKCTDGSKNHGELKGLKLIDEFKIFFMSL